MSSGNKDFVLDSPRPATVSLLLAAPKTFIAATEGHNALQLNCVYTRAAGTALTFTFEVKEFEVQDSLADVWLPVKKVDVSAGTITAFSLVYTTSTTENFSFSVPITGTVRVTVTGTATTDSDILVVTPHSLVVS